MLRGRRDARGGLGSRSSCRYRFPRIRFRSALETAWFAPRGDEEPIDLDAGDGRDVGLYEDDSDLGPDLNSVVFGPGPDADALDADPIEEAVGGDPRSDRATKIKEAFGFTEVDWLEGTTTRKVDGLIAKMKNGIVDLVIVLRAFNSHRICDAVFAARNDNCHVIIAGTYGVTQIRLGLERFLGRK